MYTIKDIQENTIKKWETFRTDYQLALQATAQALPDGINGFRFSVENDESRDYQTGLDVVVDVEFLNGHKWEENTDCLPNELSDLKDFLEDQNELVSEGKYEFLKNIEKDEA